MSRPRRNAQAPPLPGEDRPAAANLAPEAHLARKKGLWEKEGKTVDEIEELTADFWAEHAEDQEQQQEQTRKRYGDVERAEKGTREAKKPKRSTRQAGATAAPMDTDGNGGDGDGRNGGSSDGLNGSVGAMDIDKGAEGDSVSTKGGGVDNGPCTTPMEIGGGDDGGAGTGGGGAGGGGQTSGQREPRKNKPVGQRGLRSTTLSQEIEEPVLPCMEPFLENNRRISDERAEEHRDMAPRTPSKRAGAGTIADAARFLAMLSHTKKDGIEIKEGIYFPRSGLGEIKSQYELDYAFNPSDIEVEVGKTKVTWNGKVKKVEAFDYGFYILDDKDKSKITQWDVLQNRFGKGVTLEQDIRRYIGQLALTYVVMQTTGVVEIENDGNVHDGMMLDVNSALNSAQTSLDGIDPDSQLTREDLLCIKNDVDKVRGFALEIFTSSSVRDILPLHKPSAMESEVSILFNSFLVKGQRHFPCFIRVLLFFAFLTTRTSKCWTSAKRLKIS